MKRTLLLLVVVAFVPLILGGEAVRPSPSAQEATVVLVSPPLSQTCRVSILASHSPLEVAEIAEPKKYIFPAGANVGILVHAVDPSAKAEIRIDIAGRRASATGTRMMGKVWDGEVAAYSF